MQEQVSPSDSWVGRHLVLVDSVVAVAALLADVVLAPHLGGHPERSPVEVVLVALSLALLPLRRRWPVPVLAATLVTAASAVLMLGNAETAAVLAPLGALYLVALTRVRRRAVLAWAVTTAVLVGASALSGPTLDVGLVLPLLPWTTVAAVLGDAVRNRRAYLMAVEERAERAERTREDEAKRRVAEERLRIARELHDVVAHHTAVVTVQAGVAQHLLLTQPEAASAALAQVRDAASSVLDELGDILSVLREPDADLATASAGPAASGDGRAPTPGLDRLDALVESFGTAGLEVSWSMDGRPRPLPPAVDLVAYRVAEESLTNALKHGTGSARLSVAYAESSLRLRVDNPVRSLVPSGADPAHAVGVGTGHGMLGMRERATAVGGTFTAGPVGDRFTVEAVLPLREAAQQ